MDQRRALIASGILAASAILYRVVSGRRSPSRREPRHCRLPGDGSAPKPPEGEKHFGEGSRDVIEEASWESFPASDPPAW